MSFFDPQFNQDGTPYGPRRYKELSHQCYIISKRTNTSYLDCMYITPTQRTQILEFLVDDDKKQKEIMEDLQAKHKR